MKRKFIILSILFTFLAINPLYSIAGEISTILILPFDNATGEKNMDSLQEGAPDLLTAFLTPYADQIKIVDRDLLDQVFEEQSLNFQGYLEKNAYQEIGQMVQAKYVVRGSISKEGENLGLNVQLYETETTQLVKSFSDFGRMKDLNTICQRITRDMAAFLKTDSKDLPELPVDENPEKNLYMIYGLGYYHNGQYHQAISNFMKVLKIDDGDESAHYWLAKSFLAKGDQDHARIEFEKFLEEYPDSQKVAEIKEHLKISNVQEEK